MIVDIAIERLLDTPNYESELNAINHFQRTISASFRYGPRQEENTSIFQKKLTDLKIVE